MARRNEDVLRDLALAQALILEKALLTGGNSMAVPSGYGESTSSVFMNLYEPGKRNPTPALLLNRNPDRTVNLILSDGNGGVRFVFNAGTSRPYNDDASVAYAEFV